MAVIHVRESFLIEPCKISTAANGIGEFSCDRTERHGSEDESFLRGIEEGCTQFQNLILFACRINHERNGIDLRFAINTDLLKWSGQGSKDFPLNLGSILPDLPPPALTNLSQGSYTADSSVRGRGKTLPLLPLRLSLAGTHTWDSLIKELRDYFIPPLEKDICLRSDLVLNRLNQRSCTSPIS